MQGKRGIVLFAHGSRDAAWRKPVEAVAARVLEKSPGVLVACAYLELMEPDLATAVAAMVRDGASHVDVVPMFLGVGRHAREDLPRMAAQIRAEHPDCRIEVKDAVGENPRLIDLLAEIAAG
jgi:sirohydrochlorin cobaltochelatase